MREADSIYAVMTRDLGLLKATAMGARKETSKLRGNIEPFSLSTVSFVKGREHWRLTSAELIHKISSPPSLARPFALLEQLIKGEIANPELFDAVEEAILFYPEHGRGAPESSSDIHEANLVSKILFHLGYLKKSDMSLDKKSLVKAINEGIQASHL